MTDQIVETHNLPATVEMADGTSTPKAYLIFARKQGVKLGLRPLLMPHPFAGEVFVGFRLRAMPDDNAPENVVSFSPEAAIQNAFPGIQFEKLDEVRGSLVGGMKIPMNIHKGKALKDFIAKSRLAAKTVGAIMERVGDAETESVSELQEYITDTYFAIIDKHTGVDFDEDSAEEFEAKELNFDDLKAIPNLAKETAQAKDEKDESALSS